MDDKIPWQEEPTSEYPGLQIQVSVPRMSCTQEASSLHLRHEVSGR